MIPVLMKHRRTLNKREEKQCAVHQCQDSPGHADYSKIVTHSENALSAH